MTAKAAFFFYQSTHLNAASHTSSSRCFLRLLTESKQAEFIHKARILMQLEKYEEAVSIWEKKQSSAAG